VNGATLRVGMHRAETCAEPGRSIDRKFDETCAEPGRSIVAFAETPS
jgi:diaminopimelate decarboxylase